MKLFWSSFSRISRHVMTENAWCVSLCSRYSNWLGDALTDQSEIVIQSDLVRHCFRSGCQQIDNLCFTLMFNIDFDQFLIIECFYKRVTFRNTNMLNHFFIFIYYSYYYLFNNRALNCQQLWKCSNRRQRRHFGITGKPQWKPTDSGLHSAAWPNDPVWMGISSVVSWSKL